MKHPSEPERTQTATKSEGQLCEPRLMLHRTFLCHWLKVGLLAAGFGSAGAADFEIWTGPDGTVLLQGSMDRGSRDLLVAAASRGLEGERRMVEYIRIDESSSPPRWPVSLARVLPEVLRIKGDLNLKVTDDGKIAVHGTLEDAADRERIENSLQAAFPRGGVTIGSLNSRQEIEREKAIQAMLAEKSGGKTGAEALAHFLDETVIYFDSASVALGDSEKEKLDLLAAAMLRNQAELTGATIVIQGFTDGKGSEETNRWYRETRCQAVRDFLVNAGVAAAGLAIAEKEGVPSRPTVVEESSEDSGEKPAADAEAENPRRVEFRREDQLAETPQTGVAATEDVGSPATGVSNGDVQPEVVPQGEPGSSLEPGAEVDGSSDTAVTDSVRGEGVVDAPPGDAATGSTQIGVEGLLASSFVDFGSGSTWLSREGRLRLEQVAEAMGAEKAEQGAWKLEIVGSSDTKGDPEVNAWLRKNRCKSVVNQLVALGVDPERLVVVAGEEEAPRARVVGAENDTARDAAGRRVSLRAAR